MVLTLLLGFFSRFSDWFFNLTTIEHQLRLMWVEFVVGPHLALRLFLQVLCFSNLTTIEQQPRLMWVELLLVLALRLFLRVLWFFNLTTLEQQLHVRLMWVEFVVGPHLSLRLFLQVLWFFNLTTIEHQLRLMWLHILILNFIYTIKFQPGLFKRWIILIYNI